MTHEISLDNTLEPYFDLNSIEKLWRNNRLSPQLTKLQVLHDYFKLIV